MPNNAQLPITSLLVTHCIGIDPDLKESGFAVWNREADRFDIVETLSFDILVETILTHFPPDTAIIRIDAGWLIGKVWHGEPVRMRTLPINVRLANACETGRRVGLNAGVGLSLVHLLRGKGYDVYEVKPGTTGWGEWDQATAKRLTGWPRITNDEKRDAMRLSFKR